MGTRDDFSTQTADFSSAKLMVFNVPFPGASADNEPVLSRTLAIALMSCIGAAWAAEPEPIIGSSENRVFWVIPNYRTVEKREASAPLRPRDKLTIALKDSFDPYSFPVDGVFAAYAHVLNQYPSWGRGTDGFAKRYAGAFADQTMSNLMAEGLFPILLRQDPRFLRLGRGGFLHRLGYAASRTFVGRSDSGSAEFNYSEFGGNAVMAVASNLYYPPPDRTLRDVAVKFGGQLGFDLVGNVFKEFWPDIRRSLTGR